jgi:hypothetical protein
MCDACCDATVCCLQKELSYLTEISIFSEWMEFVTDPARDTCLFSTAPLHVQL